VHTHIGRTSFVLASVVGLGAVVGLLASTTPGCKAFDADPVPDADASADAATSADARADASGPTCAVAGEACGSCCPGFDCVGNTCCARANSKATKVEQCCAGTSFHSDGYCRTDPCVNAGDECNDPGACCAGSSCAYDQATSPNADRCLAVECKALDAPCGPDIPCCRTLRCDIVGGAFKCVKQ